jgi:ATP synthase protein I
VKNFSKIVAGELTSRAAARYNSSDDGSCDRPATDRFLPEARVDPPLERPDPRDSTSVGILWASRITAVGLEFALPAVGGLFLDRKWSLGPLGLIAGVILGFALGMVHLLSISREGSGAKRPD